MALQKQYIPSYVEDLNMDWEAKYVGYLAHVEKIAVAVMQDSTVDLYKACTESYWVSSSYNALMVLMLSGRDDAAWDYNAHPLAGCKSPRAVYVQMATWALYADVRGKIKRLSDDALLNSMKEKA